MTKTPESGGRIPVAMYVRYASVPSGRKPFAQQRLIRRYATRHNMNIVASYMDFGKSGLGERPALQRMLADIQSGKAAFRAVLLSDVSRWSRFHDPDEAAHYEYLCRHSGIEVIYAGELRAPRESSRINALAHAIRRAWMQESEFRAVITCTCGKRKPGAEIP